MSTVWVLHLRINSAGGGIDLGFGVQDGVAGADLYRERVSALSQDTACQGSIPVPRAQPGPQSLSALHEKIKQPMNGDSGLTNGETIGRYRSPKLINSKYYPKLPHLCETGCLWLSQP